MGILLLYSITVEPEMFVKCFELPRWSGQSKYQMLTCDSEHLDSFSTPLAAARLD